MPDVPEEIEIQRKRQKFMVSKVIEELADEDENLLARVENDLGNITLLVSDEKPSGCCRYFSSKSKNMYKTNGDKKLADVPTQLYNHAYQGVDTADGV